MIRPAASEMLVRGVALYLPVLVTAALALHRRPDRARATAALVATAWNVPALLAVNVVAVRIGWWSFEADTATVAGVPADLWLGWALLWGAVPVLVAAHRPALAGLGLVVLDLVLMPLGQPVVVLDGTWLVGEAVAVATCLAPALLLGHWTAARERVRARAALQVAAFSGLLLYVIPSLAFTVTDEGWGPLLQRPRWLLVATAVVLAPAAAAAVQAVREFAAHGGTPVPLDPPASLVTTGPYAYVANPMQLGATVLLAAWGVLLASPAVVASAAVAAAFSAGLAAWSEDSQMGERFGEDWHRYRERVRLWVPRWRPAVDVPAAVYVAQSCEPCRDVGGFIERRTPVGLHVEPAEHSDVPLSRITYRCGDHRAIGVAAVARSLEHANLGWAVAGWMARLPGIEQILQLVTDAVGGGPRTLVREA